MNVHHYFQKPASLSVLTDPGMSVHDIHADVFFTPEEKTIQTEGAL